MLFSSPEFIFCFLPCVALGYVLLQRHLSHGAAMGLAHRRVGTCMPAVERAILCAVTSGELHEHRHWHQ